MFKMIKAITNFYLGETDYCERIAKAQSIETQARRREDDRMRLLQKYEYYKIRKEFLTKKELKEFEYIKYLLTL